MNIGLTGSSGVLGTKLKKMLKLKKKNFFLGKIENSTHVNNWIKSNRISINSLSMFKKKLRQNFFYNSNFPFYYRYLIFLIGN